MKKPTGQALIDSIRNGRSVCPDSMNNRQSDSWRDNKKNCAGLMLFDIWFYESNDGTNGKSTHGDIFNDVIRSFRNSNNSKGILKELKSRGIAASKKLFSRQDIENIGENSEWRNTYNFRYFPEFHCLTFWGLKKDINLSKVGDIINVLNLAIEDLVISFSEGSNSEAHLASELDLKSYNECLIKSEISSLPSYMLHLIACKKEAIEGWGSKNNRYKMPYTKYKNLIMSSD